MPDADLREIAQQHIRHGESQGCTDCDCCKIARAYLERTEPVEIKRKPGFAVHVCVCGQAQDATKQIRINFCHYCGRPIKWT